LYTTSLTDKKEISNYKINFRAATFYKIEVVWYDSLMFYTRKGDKGKTKLFNTKNGVSVSKSSQITEVLGTEINLVIRDFFFIC